MDNNMEKYVNAFVEVLGVNAEEAKTLQYRAIRAWDSVGHMELVGNLENTFDIMMDTDDIVDFSSFEKGIEILKKYGVEL